MRTSEYVHSVFLNCPFDAEYRPLFEAAVFAIQDCGYIARCALELDDSSEARIEKIANIIRICKFGIHDISRTEPDSGTGLPRFNMPLELGLFLGAKRFGRAEQRQKICLVLDTEKYRYQKYISDIAGQDIAAHGGQTTEAIRAIRNFLSSATPATVKIPGGAAMAHRYGTFRTDLPLICERLKLSEEDLTFNDYVVQVEEWLKLNA